MFDLFSKIGEKVQLRLILHFKGFTTAWHALVVLYRIVKLYLQNKDLTVFNEQNQSLIS